MSRRWKHATRKTDAIRTSTVQMPAWTDVLHVLHNWRGTRRSPGASAGIRVSGIKLCGYLDSSLGSGVKKVQMPRASALFRVLQARLNEPFKNIAYTYVHYTHRMRTAPLHSALCLRTPPAPLRVSTRVARA